MSRRRRSKRRRNNPHLMVLYNPERYPRQQLAESAWNDFHDGRPKGGYHVVETPDVRGLPGTVVALGVCEGFELTRQRRKNPHTTVQFTRDRSQKNGPWVVREATRDKNTRLWVVGNPDGRHDSKIARCRGMYMKAIYYFPPGHSPRHDRDRGYRHEFGETGDPHSDPRARPERDWPRFYPELELLDGARAVEMVRPRNGFTVEARGIVG